MRIFCLKTTSRKNRLPINGDRSTCIYSACNCVVETLSSQCAGANLPSRILEQGHIHHRRERSYFSNIIQLRAMRDSGSPVVKATDHDRHVMSSSPIKTHHAGEAMHVKSVESSNAIPLAWCGS
ncbi:hypothetical protein TNCV_4540211 [Trichonephila clavipes]|nr:hypothetical protein TNCV_4540211 [Trichonephila clavipes]